MKYSVSNIIFHCAFAFFILNGCIENHSEKNEEIIHLNEQELAINKKLDEGFQILLSNPGEARQIALKVLSLLEINENIQLIIRATRLKGASYQLQGNYPLAFDCYLRALSFASQEEDMRNIAATKNNIGILNLKTGNHREAMEYFSQSLHYYKEVESINNQAKVINNIGLIYLELNNFDKAEESFLEASELYLLANDSINYSAPLGNLGLLYASQNLLEKAMQSIDMGIEIAQKSNNNYTLTILYNEKAKVFLENNKLNDAEIFFERTIELAKVINKPYRIATGILGLSEVYILRGDLNKALEETFRAIDIAENIDNPILLYECHEILSRIYTKQDDHSNALISYKHYRELKDDLINQTTLHHIYNIEISSLNQTNQLQQLEIERKELEISKKNNLLWFNALIFALSITGLYFFYLNRRNQQRVKLQQTIIKFTEKKSLAAVDAEIQERKRIGQELHDSLGQLLSVAGLNLNVLVKKKSISDQRKEELLNAAISSIDEAFTEVRNISHNLAPSLLSERGLQGALKNLSDQINQSKHIHMSYETFGLNGKLNTLVENTLFRAIQEMLNNTIKHSQAQDVSFQIAQGASEITLMAEDNGIGFDTQKAQDSNGHGLTHMKTRIENLNGSMHIDSNPNRGTIISIVIPLNPKQNVA